ncbi:MAG TPA: aminoacyl-tRNA hydrolase [Phycisphaerales bacterium]|nr:aminoacyl-tRNA hydrolase [Phycisphaerales bacterium]
MGACWTDRRERRDGLDEHRAGVRLIVGLGNPGREYQGTRHNVGFETVDRVGDRLHVEIDKRKFGGLVGQGTCGSQRVLLLKPLQYMNCSGQVVATAAGFYRVSPADLLVVTDDMALEPGRIRLRAQGSSGGHNGLADIIEKLGTDRFARLRIGIGAATRVARDYVLSRPTAEERTRLDEAIDRAVEAVVCWLDEGIETAMNRYNVKAKDETQTENES